jgi:predicted HicB family RNase H-like nuclease
MPKQTKAKRERVVEAVRRGLEGEAAVEFIHQSGYAITVAAIARHLRSMGGRGRVQELIDEGKSNIEIMRICFAEEDLDNLRPLIPMQEELFVDMTSQQDEDQLELLHTPVYETAKISARLPAELYDAIRIAAKAERKTQNQLIVELLTTALSSKPINFPEEQDTKD